MTRFLFPLLVVGTLAAVRIFACGPFFPNSFLVLGDRDLLDMPAASFWIECRQVIWPEGLPPEPGPEAGMYLSLADLHQKTVERDLADFALAVEGRADARDLTDSYRALREALQQSVTASFPEFPWMQPSEPRTAAGFDPGPYEETIARLPQEFSLYLRGAIAYHKAAFDEAKSRFAEVLALPADQRKFRSTWAAFMIGKCQLALHPAEAAAAFERTRWLAAEGFQDSLELAGESLGWQARSEMLSGSWVQAIRHYVEQGRHPASTRSVIVSLDWLCHRALQSEVLDPALVRDDLSRRILTAWSAAHPNTRDAVSRWLQALEYEKPGSPLPQADRLAWAAYASGDIPAAERWLALADPGAPYGQWVKAKLLLREGKAEEAASLLKVLAPAFPAGPGWGVQSIDTEFEPDSMEPRTLVTEDLAMVLVRNGDYTGAMAEFLRAGNWTDASLLAERVLSLEELEFFVADRAAKPPSAAVLNQGPDMPSRLGLELEYLLARRLARAGRWDHAVSWYPEEAGELLDWRLNTGAISVRELAAQVAHHLRDAANESGRRKAESLFQAGKILGQYGMELMGTELGPDWTSYGGDFFRETKSEPDQAGRSPWGDEFARRFLASAPSPNERFHYRFVASDLMWQTAELLPNNDVLTAHALYLGGVFLKHWYPQSADRFYKALVRRNPNLKIARDADRLRWFPKEFTDVVLYYPPYHPPSKKKIAAVALLLMLPLAALTGWAFRRKRAAARPGL